MKTIKKVLRALGALVLAGSPIPVLAQAVGGNNIVQGTAPSGATATGNPVQMGGKDGSGNARAFKVDTSGELYIANPGSPASSVAISNQAVTHYLGVDASGLIGINNFPSSQAVTGTFWPYILGQTTMSASVPVAIASNQSALAVSGTFWQSVQPVSQSGSWSTAVTSLPALPAGSNVIGHVITDSGSTTAVTGTVAVSAASLPLPSGASTAANQTAVQSASGTPNGTAITIQGNASGVPVPISGSITATNASVSTTGSAVPGSATMLGGTDGTNLRAISTDSSGRPNVNINGTATVSGTVALSAGSAVIGHVITDSGSTTAVTGNVTAVQSSGSNLHVNVDSAPTTTVTGTVTANVGTTNGLALDATLTGGTQKTQIVSSGGTAAGVDATNSLYTCPNQVEYASLSTSSSGTDLLPAATVGDVRAYHTVSFHFTSIGTGGQMQVQCSNDNSNWVTMVGTQNGGYGSGTGSSVSTITTTGLYVYTLNAHYLRVHTTALTSGTATGVVDLFTSSPMLVIGNNTNATQSGIWTVQQGSTPSATPWAVNIAAATSGGYSYSHLASNATTTVKSGAGFLHTITINTLGTADTATLYDNTTNSGTIIAVINTAVSQGTLTFDCAFSTGLTLVLSGTTAPDLTVNYK